MGALTVVHSEVVPQLGQTPYGKILEGQEEGLY